MFRLGTERARKAVEILEAADTVRQELLDLLDEADRLCQAANDALDALYTYVYESIVLEETNLVTPGTLIFGEFTFDNESNVDTYFRISKGLLEIIEKDNGESSIDDLSLAHAIIRYGDEAYDLVEDGEWLYCPIILAPDADIEIIAGAYIFGAANGNDVQNVKFSLDGVDVEIIQASNNAAHLAGWGENLAVDFWQN